MDTELTTNKVKGPLVFGSPEANAIADIARIEEEERQLDAQLDRELRDFKSMRNVVARVRALLGGETK